MNIPFPKEYSHLLNDYNISKEFNKNKSFLLSIDIPDFIYGFNKKYWFLAYGKGGLYQFEDSKEFKNELSLNEVCNHIESIQYDFILGYKKEEKFISPHPISGKITEWTPESAYEITSKLKKRIPELESVIMKDAMYAYWYAMDVMMDRWPEAESIIIKDARWAYYYAKGVINNRWLEAEPIIMKDRKWSFYYADFFNLKIVNGELVD